MIIREIFEKPIDRNIKGVIKVGQNDSKNVYQELDEYVVTKELTKHFRDFFANYKKGITGDTDSMGVWISGFFGSGKSHFLKILSYLLENREVEGRRAIDFFNNGKKITDQMVVADIELAGNTSCEVILFNIDSKATADSKSHKDGILEVFLRVFNERQGYCGQLPFLANLEREFDEEGVYEEFKIAFEKISGTSWGKKRQAFLLNQSNFVKAVVSIDRMTEEEARTWCKNAKDSYKISIGDFANLIKKHCVKEGKNHHVVFLVDEIGQYIADDTNLMLNLQTVVEDLGKICNGKAWVIVTSQQAIDSITKVKSNDFSKIMGRFDTKLILSPTDVDEVIKKRILTKTKAASDNLEIIYEQKEAIIKNLMTFTTDTAFMRLYGSSKEFAEVYPFVPYQFDLLGKVLTSIRENGASGQHLAEGERSMLALYKESTMAFADSNEGTIVPFSTFYNALDEFIYHTHRDVVLQSIKNEKLQPFDTQILKALLMLKYVKEIKTSVENLTTLMVSNIDDDRIKIKQQVEDSLRRLTGETLVQKNGQIYTFLTNEEQDINKQIKNEHVELAEVINEVSEIIFEEIFKDKKYRHSARYNFAFNQKVDDRIYKNNQNNDMGISILTPYYEEADESKLRMLSAQSGDAILLLPNDSTFLDEIMEVLKITKFIKKHGIGGSQAFESVKIQKQAQLSDKKTHIKMFVEEALKNAEIFVNGNKAQIPSGDPATRINNSLAKLVEVKFSKLSYMETSPILSDIEAVFAGNNQMTMSATQKSTANSLALASVLEVIHLNNGKSMKTSLKNLFDRFKVAPYGFIDEDVQWLVATLYKQGKVTYNINAKSIFAADTHPNDLVKLITNKVNYEKLLIDERKVILDSQIKDAKQILKDLFNFGMVGDDEDVLMKDFKDKSSSKIKIMDELLKEYYKESRLPGEKVLNHGKALLGDVLLPSEPAEFYKKVSDKMGEFLDLAEKLKPVEGFFAGNQVKIFREACDILSKYEKSKPFISDRSIFEAADKMIEIIKMPNPYGHIQALPGLREAFLFKYVDLLDKERGPVEKTIHTDMEDVLQRLTSEKLKIEFAEKFELYFKNLIEKSKGIHEISALKSIISESDALKINCFNKMDAFLEKTKVTPEKKSKNISINNLTTKSWRIENQADIDKYLNALGESIKKEFEENAILNISI